MKKILFYLLTILPLVGLLFSCSDDEDVVTNFKDYNKDKLNQTTFADTELEKTFSFTATEDWSIMIDDKTTTPSSKVDADWLTVSPMHGEAGPAELTITMEKNFTGADRNAEININSGDSKITIMLKQSATTEEGKIPVSTKVIASIIGSWTSEEGLMKDEHTFTYNDAGQLVLYKVDSQHDGVASSSVVYENNKMIVNKQSWQDIKYVNNLNSEGMVASAVVDYGENREKMDYVFTYEDGYLKETKRDNNIEYVLDWENKNLKRYKVDMYHINTTTFSYTTDCKNNANLDLNVFLSFYTFDRGGAHQIVEIPALIRKTGKSSMNISDKTVVRVEWEGTARWQEFETNYTYDFDKDGFPVKITATEIYRDPDPKNEGEVIVDEGGTITYTIEYKK